MRGIVRGMDAAPEAYREVFTAFPRVHTRTRLKIASGQRCPIGANVN